MSSGTFTSLGIAARRRGLLCACSILIGALTLGGCAPAQDNQQPADEDLRNTVAADRQQINALQDQVAQLNDQIAEMQHNGDTSGDSSGDSAKIAELEREVQALKGGSSATASQGPVVAGAAPPSGPGASTEANAAANGPPPNGPAPSGAPGDTAAAPPNGPNTTDVAGTPPANPGEMTAPPPSGSAGNAPPANATAGNDSDDADDKGDNSDNDNGSQIASNAPPTAAAPPAAPGPPIVNGSPSWRGVLDQEIAAAQSSGDPAAKAYRAGLINMKAGKYSNAIGIFQGLQRRYPKSPLSEPAEYFSATALFELGKYDESILQFNDLVMRFPRGRFASASLLSEAQAFIKMNDRIDARLTLQKLISDHPDAPEAATAQAMINSLANG